jgi:hypothetical protein
MAARFPSRKSAYIRPAAARLMGLAWVLPAPIGKYSVNPIAVWRNQASYGGLIPNFPKMRVMAERDKALEQPEN